MDTLDNKVAVVTGSASGLGRAMAERFAAEGAVAVVADNRLADAEGVAEGIRAKGGRALAIEVDVADRDSVIALADRVDAELGGTDVLVNNAGVVSYTPIAVPEEQGWRWILDVNLMGVVHGLQTFLPRIIEGGSEGHVVNTSSLAGVVGGGGIQDNRIDVGDATPEPSSAMYGYMATKHAVVAISESLARDLSGSRIGVSVLCPSHHENTGIFENSARFRPEVFGGPMSDHEVSATMGNTDRERDKTYGQPRQERFPDECAARVVRAIREGHFYVFTHPETRAAIEHRFRQLLAGFDDATSIENQT